MTLLGLVTVRGGRGQAKKISWKANSCLEKWVTMALNMSIKVDIYEEFSDGYISFLVQGTVPPIFSFDKTSFEPQKISYLKKKIEKSFKIQRPPSIYLCV